MILVLQTTIPYPVTLWEKVPESEWGKPGTNTWVDSIAVSNTVVTLRFRSAARMRRYSMSIYSITYEVRHRVTRPSSDLQPSCSQKSEIVQYHLVRVGPVGTSFAKLTVPPETLGSKYKAVTELCHS